MVQTSSAWDTFSQRHALTPVQRDQFTLYYERLVAANKLFNITTRISLDEVLGDHFDDSLALMKVVDCTRLQGLADIGTGGGFPAMPIKICVPSLPITLIEVNAKKRQFLTELVLELGLTHVTVSELDWRTFLRKTSLPIDLFCARASLQPRELVRMFMPTSPYKQAQLVYWASAQWEPPGEVAPYVRTQHTYKVGPKQRMLVIFGA